jgi:hypothetical protein
LKRAKYIIVGVLLILFCLTLQKAIKNEGGMSGEFDDNKWVVKHRKSFEILVLGLLIYVFLSLVDPERPSQDKYVKDIMLGVFSNLSMPLTVCSGGVCSGIYISTITSILTSFSLPITVVVPFFNVLGYLLQVVGLISVYSVNKWHSMAFWIYLVGMVSQILVSQWIGIVMIIGSVILNAKTNKFVFGRKKIFK